MKKYKDYEDIKIELEKEKIECEKLKKEKEEFIQR